MKKEQEIKLKLVRPRNLDAHFKRIMDERQNDDKDNDDDQQLSNEERFFKNDSVKYMIERSLDRKKMPPNVAQSKNVHRTKSVPTAANENDGDDRLRYHQSKGGHQPLHFNEKSRKPREHFDNGLPYNENLTDKEKYHQSLMKKQHSHREYYENSFRTPADTMSPQQKRRESKPTHRADDHAPMQGKAYRHEYKSSRYDEPDFDRNAAMQSMTRHRSPDNCAECDDADECTSECERDFIEKPYPMQYNRPVYDPRQRSGHANRISPDAHERPKESGFHGKEKFQHMDRHWHQSADKEHDRSYAMDKHSKHSRRMISRQDIPDMSLQPPPPPPPNVKTHVSHNSPGLEWSSDDEHFGRTSSPSNVRIIPREHYEKNSGSRLAPAKSLGNLAKGYRHSYAEPVHGQMPRSSGRVGLAAVNPY